MNILKERFALSFAEPNDCLSIERKCDKIISNDEPIKKKKKKTDFDNQSDNACFVDVEGEEVEGIFLIIVVIPFLSFFNVLFIKLHVFFCFSYKYTMNY